MYQRDSPNKPGLPMEMIRRELEVLFLSFPQTLAALKRNVQEVGMR